jgi:hypothetical protein
VIRESIRSMGQIELIGAVRGLLPEATRVVDALATIDPDALGLGLSPEEVAGLQQYFVGQASEPVVPLTSNEIVEARGLIRFGEVSVPNPSFIASIEWAQGRGIPVEPLDAPEDEGASMFARNIGYFELVRRTLREHKLTRNPPKPSTPDEYALQWDQTLAKGKGSKQFARARDTALVTKAQAMLTGRSRVALVVDRERFPQVLEMFREMRTWTT